jgi:hypothetical protein
MGSLVYNSFMRDIATGQVDCDTDTFKMMLVNSSYTASKSHSRRSDIKSPTDYEVTGTGYTAGGNACALTVATTDNVNNDVEISFSVSSWTSATITARAGVIYKSRGGIATADELVGYVDFLSNITSTNGTFAVTVSTPLKLTNPEV